MEIAHTNHIQLHSVQQRFIKSLVRCQVLGVQREKLPGGAYSTMGEQRMCRDNFHLVAANAKIESSSITVTHKVREQGRDQSEEPRNTAASTEPGTQI